MSVSGTVTAVSRNGGYSFTKPNREEIVLVAGIGVEGDTHAGVLVRHRGRVAADPTQPNLRQVHLIHAELFEEVAGKGYEVPPGGLGENVTTSGIDLLGLPRGTILRFGEPDAPGASAGVRAPVDAGGRGVADGGGRGVADGGGRGVADGGAGGAELDAGVLGHPVAAVLAAARAATLDDETARAAEAVRAAVERDAAGGDPRPAIVVAGLRNPCVQINGYRSGLLKEVVGRDQDGNLVRKAGVMAVVLRGGPVRPGDPVTVELPPSPHGPLERV
ncbi:transcription elongation factor [Actinoplanes sp. NBC_00393]|uniref:MOSC domain-containing protein n=1 Tax=Actinoplanes sp. NBC_00393 TaxID=2975953 RepID=UPI002E1F513A